MGVLGQIAYLGFAGVPPTILGLAFILSPSVLYPFYAAAPRVTPLSPLDDQLAAGLVMFGLGNLIYFVAIWVIFFRLSHLCHRAGKRSPRWRRSRSGCRERTSRAPPPARRRAARAGTARARRRR